VTAPAPRSPQTPGQSAIQFGQVWESPDEAIGVMRYLIVSGDAYNAAFGDRRAIAVEIDSRSQTMARAVEVRENRSHGLTGGSWKRNQQPATATNTRRETTGILKGSVPTAG
jgi:hypothetical protein